MACLGRPGTTGSPERALLREPRGSSGDGAGTWHRGHVMVQSPSAVREEGSLRRSMKGL